MPTPAPPRLRTLLLIVALLPGLASAVAEFDGLGLAALSLTGVDRAQTRPTGRHRKPGPMSSGSSTTSSAP